MTGSRYRGPPGSITERLQVDQARLVRDLNDRREEQGLRWYQVAQQIGCDQRFAAWGSGIALMPLRTWIACMVWLGEPALSKYVRVRPRGHPPR